MATNKVNSGYTRNWTNGTGSDVVSSQVVVVGEQLAVALVDIADGASGTVATDGRYTVPKVSGAVIGNGESVIWDASAAAFDDNAATPASGDVSAGAVAAEAAGNGDTSVDIILSNLKGTVA